MQGGPEEGGGGSEEKIDEKKKKGEQFARWRKPFQPCHVPHLKDELLEEWRGGSSGLVGGAI